jgi:hypothetical protein
MSRLASGFWVRAYLKRLEMENIPAYVIAHGHDEAGAVLVKCATLDGNATAWHRSFDLMTGERAWVVLKDGPERDVDESIRKQRSFDPDLWVVEIESRDGRSLLDQEGLTG